MALLTAGTPACRTVNRDAGLAADPRTEAEIRRLYELERDNLLRMDIDGQARFLPDDFVVTNPFGMFITKHQVLERLQKNIIKYDRYDRTFDAFRRYGDALVVIGSETVVPSSDATRPDAGQTVHRRFTEFWVRRDGRWQKVVRHASNLTQQ